MITKQEILKLKCELVQNRKVPDSFDNVSIDSRNVNGNSIFIAIKGETTDGHNYIDKVVKSKVRLIFVNKKWYTKNKNKYPKQNFVVVADTIKTLGQLALIHRDRMNIPVFAVAGSNGKTSTKDIIAEVFAKKFNVIKTEGNFNNHIGLPLTLLRIEDHHNFCVAELGSNHFNELEYLCNIAKPDFALVTNIGKEHLEFFKDLKGVAKEEFQVYDWVNKNGSCCFYNLDDSFIKAYYGKHKNNSFTYSYKYSSDVKGKMEGFDNAFRPKLTFKYNNKNYKTYINTFGKHSYFNGLSAIAVGIYFGIQPSVISDALKSISNISSKRMEFKEYRGIKVINDAYNSNPDSVKLGLETMKDFKSKGRKHIILSDMLEMGKASKSEHTEIGSLLKKMNFDFNYFYGDMSYHTFKGARGLKNSFYFEDKADLSVFLKVNIKDGDILYVKGSRGMKMEEVIQDVFTNKLN
ncbi:MAG: UDP-N-acetylmuramoyl-tripeptide--D-alanyl-D-alanine ligase [Ignavibacteria bacterium]